MNTETRKIKLTLACAAHLGNLCGEEESICLVVQVRGGGCSGLQYAFGSKPKVEPSDVVLYDMDFVKVVTDPKSAPYLEGSTIDYHNDGLSGSGIKITNPNAERVCGCQHSFTPKKST